MSNEKNGSPAITSFSGRGHAKWMVIAGANPREKWIHDADFGHYGMSVAKVSFEHAYSHNPERGAEHAADYAERLVACADAMKGIADPRAFIAAVCEVIEAAKSASATLGHAYHTVLSGEIAKRAHGDYQRLDAALDAALDRIGCDA